MPVSISDYFGIPKDAFDATGAFDAILDVDSRLFIDPQLLRQTEIPEFATASATLEERFVAIMQLLRSSQSVGDIFWRNADRLFDFPELRGLCIGYSRRSTRGSGMGEQLRAQLLDTAKQIVDAGVDDPAFFEWLGLLEKGVGADRISDMLGRIAAQEIARYSERVFDDLGVESRETYAFGGTEFRLPTNPFGGGALLLAPLEVLRNLPVAESWADIDDVVSFNADLRARLNEIIGSSWRKARYIPKRVLRDRLLQNPELFKDLLRSYKSVQAAPYSIRDDPAGEVQWYSASIQYSLAYPIKLVAPTTPDEAMKVVLEICRQYAFLIEESGLSELLYDSKGKPKHESAAQKLFFGVAYLYCKANDLDISPEANGGRGEVDFKFSRGFSIRVVVEEKLTSNDNLEHGFTVQLEEYAKAEETDQRVYLVIDVDKPGAAERLGRFKELVATKQAAGEKLPIVIYVNGRPKPSASVYKPESD